MPPTDFEWRGGQVIADLEAATEKGVSEAADAIFKDSQQRVPVDTGALRQSARIYRKGKFRRIYYGSSRVPYAEIQHERTDFFHTTGEAKFLDKAVRAQKRKAEQKIISAIRTRRL